MRVPATLASGDIGIEQKKASVHWQLDRVTLPSHERAMWMSTLDIAIAYVPGSVPMGHYGHTGFPSLPPFHWSVSYANAIRNDNDNKRAWIPAIGVGIVSMVNTNSYVVCMCATMSYAHRTTLTERHFQNHSKHFNNFLLFATQEKNEQKDYQNIFVCLFFVERLFLRIKNSEKSNSLLFGWWNLGAVQKSLWYIFEYLARPSPRHSTVWMNFLHKKFTLRMTLHIHIPHRTIVPAMRAPMLFRKRALKWLLFNACPVFPTAPVHTIQLWIPWHIITVNPCMNMAWQKQCKRANERRTHERDVEWLIHAQCGERHEESETRTRTHTQASEFFG